jgi:hypothetical protein
MSKPAGDFADGFELLGLEQLFFDQVTLIALRCQLAHRNALAFDVPRGNQRYRA